MSRTTLKLLRVKHGLSQDKMAKKVGYSRNHYASIENGDRDVTLKFLEGLCNAFGMSFEEAKELTERDKEESDCEARGE